MMRKLLVVCLFIAGSLACNAQSKKNQLVIDSLKNKLSTAATDTSRASLLVALSYIYVDFNYDESIKYAAMADSLSTRSNWLRSIASANNALGLNHAYKCEYSQAAKHYSKALKVYRHIGDKQGVGGVYSSLGLLELSKGNYSGALSNDFLALEIFEELDQTLNKAILLENIGTIFLERKKYDKALKYYSKAYESYKKTDNKVGIARNLGNQGIILNEEGRYYDAMKFHKLAYQTNKEEGRKNSMQVNLSNLGITCSNLKQFEMALDYHLQALKLSREIDDQKSVAIALGNAGEVYYMMAGDSGFSDARKRNLSNAIAYLGRAIDLCKKINFKGPYSEFAKFLSDAYTLAGDHKKAFETYKAYTLVKDSMFSADTRLKMAALETKREVDLKDRDITLKQQQIEIARLQLKNRQNERLFFSIGIFLLLTTIFLLYRVFHLRSLRYKKTLHDIAMFQSHDVRAPLARILGLIQLVDQDKMSPENKKVVGFLNQSAQELDEIICKTVERAS
jgi:tetratricopeptide (TPR) repeat protein